MRIRDASPVAAALQMLQDHGGRSLGIFPEHLVDVGLEGVEQRPLGTTLVARGFCESEQPIDGVAGHREPAGDRGLGATFAFEEPVDLGPVMH